MVSETDKPVVINPVVIDEIVRRRDELVDAQATLMEQRHAIMAKLRRIDRELADCRAAARFFHLEIEFPATDAEYVDNIERERAQRERAVRMAAMRAREAAERAAQISKNSAQETARRIIAHAAPPTLAPHIEPVPPKVLATTTAKETTPPTLRNATLDRLKFAGDDGLKAAQIREFYERTYGKVIHEKTVGMTLYRLLKEGAVRRDGHIWFLATPKAETGNPGADTPGSKLFD